MVLGWVALVPWLAVLDRARSIREVVLAAWLMSVAFELAVFGWFARAIETYTGAPHAAALALLALAAPLLQPQLVVFALVRHGARTAATPAAGRALLFTALVGASAYVGTEWAVPKLFADTLGYGLYPSRWLRQAADLGGVAGLTFVLVVANECVLAAVRALVPSGGGRRREALAPLAAFAALIAVLLAYGAWRTRELAASAGGRPITAGVVQANLSHYDRLAAEIGRFEAVRRILDAHFTLSTEVLSRGDVDLLVWPETVYPTTFGSPKSDDGAAFDREIGAFLAAADVPLIFGSYDVERGEEFNAAVFLAPPRRGRLAFETYRKATLFPLTERVPALLESDLVRGWLPWLGTWKPGSGPKVLSLALRDGRAVRVAPLICYDVLAPALVHAAVRQGAELIVTLSNDSWFAAGAGPRMHLVGAVFRSIETRRPQIRATNTGISAVITATGELLDTAAVDERATLVASVTPDARTTTLVLAWGDWLAPCALLAAAVSLGARMARARRSARARKRSGC
jgi:apolipoprotein N-acyltransferase